MFVEALPFLLTLISLVIYILYLLISYQKFRRQRDQLLYRVHVNGIRGKSTVTRYVAAVVREAGYKTFGKITGSTAHIIHPNGQESVWPRPGYANINEQIAVMRKFFRQRAQAVVMECMAVNPIYSEWLEHQVMRSHVGIITNVRYDHPDYLGETLEEIAHSLAVTIPENGIAITSESNPKLVKILHQRAKQKGTKLIVAHGNHVKPKDLRGFDYLAVEDNVAIALEIGKLLGVRRKQALKAMWKTLSDESALRLESFNWRDSSFVWANLFAVNDRESFEMLCERIFTQYPNHTKVILLNNRADRLPRVPLFVQLAESLNFELVVTLGECEANVKELWCQNPDNILFLGESTSFKDAAATALLSQITQNIPQQNQKNILLVGAVNIHTPQAQRLLNLLPILIQNQPQPTKPIPEEKPCLNPSIPQKLLA